MNWPDIRVSIRFGQAYEALIDREEDVIKLKNGLIKVKNLPPRNRRTRNEAFVRYLSIFYDRPNVEVGLFFSNVCGSVAGQSYY